MLSILLSMMLSFLFFFSFYSYDYDKSQLGMKAQQCTVVGSLGSLAEKTCNG